MDRNSTEPHEASLLTWQSRFLESAELALDEIGRGGNSQGILMHGDPGTGKTHVLDLLARRHPPYQKGTQPITPMIRIGTPAHATSNTLIQLTMCQLGKPQGDKEGDMHKALRARETRIVCFEEFHNALRVTTGVFGARIGQMVKNLWNFSPPDSAISWSRPDSDRGDHRLLLVISGKDDLLPVFKKDEELWNRFSRIQTERLDFFPDESFRQFRIVLQHFSHRFGVADCVYANDDDDLAARFLIACESDLRILERLIERTGSLIEKRRSRGRSELLECCIKAYKQCTGKGSSLGDWNPMSAPEREIALHVAKARERARSS